LCPERYFERIGTNAREIFGIILKKQSPNIVTDIGYRQDIGRQFHGWDCRCGRAWEAGGRVRVRERDSIPAAERDRIVGAAVGSTDFVERRLIEQDAVRGVDQSADRAAIGSDQISQDLVAAA